MCGKRLEEKMKNECLSGSNVVLLNKTGLAVNSAHTFNSWSLCHLSEKLNFDTSLIKEIKKFVLNIKAGSLPGSVKPPGEALFSDLLGFSIGPCYTHLQNNKKCKVII